MIQASSHTRRFAIDSTIVGSTSHPAAGSAVNGKTVIHHSPSTSITTDVILLKMSTAKIAFLQAKVNPLSTETLLLTQFHHLSFQVFVCPSSNGQYPITSTSCGSNYYNCVNNVPTVQVRHKMT